MTVTEIRQALEAAIGVRDGSKAEELQTEWLMIRHATPEGFWPIIQDRLDLIATY